MIYRKDSSKKKGWRLYCKTCSLARDRRRYADNESVRANVLSRSAAQHLATIHSEDPKIRNESRAKMTSRSARSQAKLRANSKWRNDRNKYVRGWMKEKTQTALGVRAVVKMGEHKRGAKIPDTSKFHDPEDWRIYETAWDDVSGSLHPVT